MHAEAFLHEQCFKEIETLCAADLQLDVRSRVFSLISQAELFLKYFYLKAVEV